MGEAAAGTAETSEAQVGGREAGGPALGRVEPTTLAYPTALLLVLLSFWTIDIVSPALPAIKADLGLSAAGAGLVFSMMFVGRLIGNFPAAYLLERAGSAATGAIGGVMLAAGSLTAAVAPDMTVLIPGRVIQGAGIALLVNAGLRSIVRAKPAQGAAITVFSIACTSGGILGLQSGGFLTDWRGWRMVFALCAMLAVIATLATLSGRIMSGRSRRAAVPAAPTRDMPVPLRSLAAPVALNFVVFTNYSVWVALPLLTERIFGASAETNAHLLFVITLVHLLAALPVGRLIRRWGSPRILAIGLIMAMAGTLSVAAAPGLLWLPAPLALYGIGMVAASSSGGDIVLQRGNGGAQAVGVLRLSSDLGLVIGPFVAGSLADALGYRSPFVAFPILMAGAAAVALLGGKSGSFATMGSQARRWKGSRRDVRRSSGRRAGRSERNPLQRRGDAQADKPAGE